MFCVANYASGRQLCSSGERASMQQGSQMAHCLLAGHVAQERELTWKPRQSGIGKFRET
jgi:hypothetical protein